jgi:5'-deoxynucleotidase YfbR-like HD superfamily hydrolase
MMSHLEDMRRANQVVKLIQHGYDVTRWHTMRSLRPQDLAQHSWAVAMMVMSLFNGEDSDKCILVQAALEHDLAEAHVGDMPRTARTDEHRALEQRVANQHSIFHDSILPANLRQWLAAADLIEAGMHAQREVALGNSSFVEVVARVGNYLDRENDEGRIPPELWRFARATGLGGEHFP